MQKALEAPATGIVTRKQAISILRLLWEPANEVAQQFRRAADTLDDTGDKAMIIEFWQQQSGMCVELENKMRELGGETSIQKVAKSSTADLSGDRLQSRRQLTDAMNQAICVMTLYREALHQPIPFDVRMLLQRHELRLRDIVNRLETLHTPAAL